MFIEAQILRAAVMLTKNRLRAIRMRLETNLSLSLCSFVSGEYLRRNKRHSFFVRIIFKLTSAFTPLLTIVAFGPTSASMAMSARFLLTAKVTRAAAITLGASHCQQQTLRISELQTHGNR